MNTHYNELTNTERAHAKQTMFKECASIFWIEHAFKIAWSDYERGRFKYDGATFVRERYENEFWEVAAFVHDWLNSIGYVGKKPDLYFIKIMIALNYGENIIFERCKWMQWTFFNTFFHKITGRFIADDIPVQLQ